MKVGFAGYTFIKKSKIFCSYRTLLCIINLHSSCEFCKIILFMKKHAKTCGVTNILYHYVHSFNCLLDQIIDTIVKKSRSRFICGDS